MVTIKGGVLKGGTTRKKKHYMDDRKPQQMRATGYSAGTTMGAPKQLEGALGPRTSPREAPRTAPATAPRTTPRPVSKPSTRAPVSMTNPYEPPKPKAKPSRSSKPMPASIPKAQGKSSRKTQGSDNSRFGYGPYPKTSKGKTSVGLSRETAVGKVLSYIVSGPASRTVEDRKKRANQIRSSYK